MKTRFAKASMLVATCVLFSAGSALAMPIAGDTITLDSNYPNNTNGSFGTTNGGEFYLYEGGAVKATPDFITFCLELQEHVYAGAAQYKVDDVSDIVMNGGVEPIGTAPSVGDPLSSATKWVYFNYVNNHIFGTHDDTLANNVQEVIWFLEGEASLSSTALDFYTAYVDGKTSSIYDPYVTALNLSGYQGGKAQSVLVSTTPVPEPTVTMLFALGVAGFAGISRRRLSNK